MATTNPSIVESARATCVLWLAAGSAAPPDLVQSLAKRNVRVLRATDGCMALARVCSHAGAAARSGVPTGTMLVFVEPAGLDDAADVLAAARRYAPRAVCWVYEASARPSLRRAGHGDGQDPFAGPDEPKPGASELSDVAGASAEPEHAGRDGRNTMSDPRPAAAGVEHAPSHDGASGANGAAAHAGARAQPHAADLATERAQVVVTPEELSVLMGDDEPSNGRPEPRGGGTNGPIDSRPSAAPGDRAVNGTNSGGMARLFSFARRHKARTHGDDAT